MHNYVIPANHPLAIGPTSYIESKAAMHIL
jgi:sulfoacetaldehyde acetyltransferase